MNREILFKAKRLDNNEWVYRYLIKSPFEKYYIYPILDKRHKNWEHSPLVEVIPETICQYTGLDDMNGKKIFENDIVDIHQTANGYNQFVIEYSDYNFIPRYYNQKTKQIRSYYNYNLDEFYELDYVDREIERIRNIFDNPELLDKEVK